MRDIKIGEYVRDTEGEIYKADKIFLNHANVEVKKHSFNIIDLIEVDDYVNGQKVVGVSNVSGWIDTKEDVIYKDHIKSIVTKEMFQNIEYRVESN